MSKKEIIFYIVTFWVTLVSGQTVLLDEDFSGGTLPVGWSNINNGGTAGQIWEFNNSRGITAGNISGNYAILDSDNYGNGNNQNASLLTPTFSTGLYETITLEFDYQYRDYNGGESCVVEVYDGTSWTEVFRKEFGDENYVSVSSGADLETINITAAAGGSSNAQVRFTYIGAWDWWWAVDNVTITATSPSSVNAYLGPGGVGNTDGTSNLVLWLNPDEGANTGSSWIDHSGNGFDFTSGTGATLNTSDVNGYNSYSFNGSSNYFEKSYESTLNSNEFSVFTVSNVTSSGAYKALVSNRDDPPGVRTRGFILYSVPTSNNWSFWTGRNSGAWQQTGTITSTASSWASQNLFYQNSTNGKRLFINNTINATSTHSMSLNTSRPFRIGAGQNESTPNFYFNGKMGEIIMFDVVINTAKRIIINNYLSAKYNFSLSSDDFYNEDTSGGDFDHKVAGIGRASDGSLHLDSQGTGIIRINTPSDLNNDEFLFWGEDVKDASYDFSASAASDYLERLDTKWRVSKRNDLGTVTVAVNASSLTLNSTDGCNNLKLIVSSSSTFVTKTTYDLTLSSGVYTATGVSFSDNDYFTIEYVDQIVVDGTQFYNGSGVLNVPNTSDDCYKLLVKSTATGALTLTENADVREVEIESGGNLVVNSGTRLQVTDGIALNGDIRLVGTSQLLQTHSGIKQITGTGSLYKDQEGTATNVYQSGYWTSPVTTNGSTFTIDGVLKDGTIVTTAIASAGAAANINFIDGHDGSKGTPITISKRWLAKLINATDWTRYIDPVTDVFNPAEGWNMKSTGSGVQNFTFVGIPNDGTYTSTINQNTLSLVGNPYPSAIDADQFISDNTSAITGTLYFYDGTNDNTHLRGSYTGGYATRVSGVGTPFSGGETPGQYIPIGQAFFVTRDVAGTSAITFENSQRSFQVRGANSKFFSKNNKTKNNLPVLRFGIEFDVDESRKYQRQLAVAFRGLTNNYDAGYDAEMFDRQPTDIGLKLNDKTTPFVISGIENFDESIVIPLYLYLDKNRDITFKIDNLENLNTNVYLKDAVTNSYYNLTGKDKFITLNIDSGTYNDRYFLTFTNTVLNIEEETFLSKNVLVYVDKSTNELVIKYKNNIEVDKIKLFSILGQEVIDWVNKKEKENESHIKLDGISEGIYIVKLQTNKGILSKKISIQK